MIEKKIKEVQDYFLSKLIMGDYTVRGNDSYKLWVVIDGKYNFILWIANGADNLRVEYELDSDSNQVMSFMDIHFSESDKNDIWSARMESINKRTRRANEAAEKEEYKRLKAKYGE